MRWAVFTCVLLKLLLLKHCFGVVCRDENGDPIDWFYLQKFPLFDSETKARSNNGYSYMFLSSKYNEGNWKISSTFINEENSFPGRTFTALSGAKDALIVAYNDETPAGGNDESDGHTKGVLAVDYSTGFWLIHSVPKYPELSMQTYSYPKTARKYGQSFLCISFNSSQADLIGKQLIFNEPNVYYSKIPQALRGKFPNIEIALNKFWRKKAPFWNDLSIFSLNGTKFQSFAKGRRFRKEIYEDYVAPALNQDLYVETWRNGPGSLKSNCTKKNGVLNVKFIKVGEGMKYESTLDHSKWAVSSKDPKWICICDINRARHQLVRGGGCVCQKNYKVAKAYQGIVSQYENCTKS